MNYPPNHIIDPRLCTGDLTPFVPHYAHLDHKVYLNTNPPPTPKRQKFIMPDFSGKTYSTPQLLTQEVGFYNILFVNETIDFLVADLGEMLKRRGILRHKVALHFNKFKQCKSKYNGMLIEYLQHHGKDFDTFCDQSDRFYELTTSQNIHFTRLVYSTSNAYHKADRVEGNHDIMVRLCILGHAFSIAMQNFADWTLYFVSNCPEKFAEKDLAKFNVTDWTQLYNNMLPHLCLALNLHEMNLDITNITTGMAIYARELMSVQHTFEALDFLGQDEHSTEVVGITRPPHFNVPKQYNIKPPVIHLRDEKKKN